MMVIVIMMMMIVIMIMIMKNDNNDNDDDDDNADDDNVDDDDDDDDNDHGGYNDDYADDNGDDNDDYDNDDDNDDDFGDYDICLFLENAYTVWWKEIYLASEPIITSEEGNRYCGGNFALMLVVVAILCTNTCTTTKGTLKIAYTKHLESINSMCFFDVNNHEISIILEFFSNLF